MQFDQPTVEEVQKGEEWSATYYVVVTSPENDYEQHIDWVIENHGRKDWEELLASSGRIVSDRADPNYNFDVYYDKVHSEVVNQSSSRLSEDPAEAGFLNGAGSKAPMIRCEPCSLYDQIG